MSKEFEILNQKLNLMYQEILELRIDFREVECEAKIKRLEYEFKEGESRINNTKDNIKYFHENIDRQKERFRKIDFNEIN